MPIPVRRVLAAAALAGLVAGSIGMAPPALGAQPTSTRVAGINIDATTIPELQDLMNRHRLTRCSSSSSTCIGSSV